MSSTNASDSGPTPPQETGRLRFQRPRMISAGPVLAVTLSGAVAGWMMMGPPPEKETSPKPVEQADTRAVRAFSSTSHEARRALSLQGETHPERVALVTSGLTATVAEIVAAKGATLSSGDPIAILQSDGFAERVAETETQLATAREEMEATVALHDRGIATSERLRAARTALATAEAGWSAIQAEREDLTVRAPFAGTIEAIDIVLGDRLTPGEEIATVVDTSSILVESAIPQADVSLMSVGQRATVHMSTGEVVPGVVTFVSRIASPDTRSFPVEVEVDNPDLSLRAGASARVEIEGPVQKVHEVSTADLSMDDAGRLSIKVVEEGHVRSYPVTILTSQNDRVLVAGLPDEIRLITVGQAFLRDGDEVAATEDSSR